MLNTKKIGYLSQLQGLSAINQLNARGYTMKLKKISNNVTVLELADKNVLISYETPVAYLDKSNGRYYRTEKKWSATTTKHINAFIGLNCNLLPQKDFDDLLNVEK